MGTYSRWGFFRNRGIGSANVFLPYFTVTSALSDNNTTVTFDIDTNTANGEFTYQILEDQSGSGWALANTLNFTDGVSTANVTLDAQGNATIVKELEILNRTEFAGTHDEIKFELLYGPRVLATDRDDGSRIEFSYKNGFDATGGYEIEGGRSIDMVPMFSTDQASNAELSNIDIITENNQNAFKTHAFFETDSANSDQTLVVNHIGDEPGELLTNITLSNTYSTTVANVTYDYDFMSLDCVTVAVGRGADGGFGLTGNPSPNDYAFALTGGGGVSRGFTAFNEWEEKTYTVEVSDGSWTNNDYSGATDMGAPIGAYNSFIYPLGNSGVSYTNIANVSNGGTGGWLYAMSGTSSITDFGTGGESIEWGHCNISAADPGLSPNSNLTLPRPYGIGDPVQDHGPWGANSIVAEQFMNGSSKYSPLPGGRGRLSSRASGVLNSGFKARTFGIINKGPDGSGGFEAEYTAWPSDLLEGYSGGGVVVNGNVSVDEKVVATSNTSVTLHGAGGNSGYVLDANVPGRDIPAPVSSQPGANGIVIVRYINSYRKLSKS